MWFITANLVQQQKVCFLLLFIFYNCHYFMSLFFFWFFGLPFLPFSVKSMAFDFLFQPQKNCHIKVYFFHNTICFICPAHHHITVSSISAMNVSLLEKRREKKEKGNQSVKKTRKKFFSKKSNNNNDNTNNFVGLAFFVCPLFRHGFNLHSSKAFDKKKKFTIVVLPPPPSEPTSKSNKTKRKKNKEGESKMNSC